MVFDCTKDLGDGEGLIVERLDRRRSPGDADSLYHRFGTFHPVHVFQVLLSVLRVPRVHHDRFDDENSLHDASLGKLLGCPAGVLLWLKTEHYPAITTSNGR